MKKRIFSLFTALALCLGLLPGTALAEDGPVTITNADGSSSVTLTAGTKYEAILGQLGGGIEAADQDNPGSDYLVYADGVLTACGTNVIYGTVSIASDLKMEGLSVDLCGRAGPALRLNGHTLTLSDGVRLRAHNQSVDGIPASANNCVFENGTIVGQGDVQIEINDYTTAAAVQDLTIKDVPDVRITGTTASGGVVENLTLENCGATILQRHESNSTVVEEGQITTDRLVSLGTLKRDNYHQETITLTGLVTEDGKIWAKGTDITSGNTQGIASDTPTAYKAGEGWVLYEPPAEGGAAKVTLDNAQCPKGGIAVGGASAVSVEVKGQNRIGSIMADGSVTVTKTNGTLNALVCETHPDANPAKSKNNYTVYGEAELGDPISLGPNAVGDVGEDERGTSSLTVTKGAKLTIPKMPAPDGGEGVGLIIFDLGEAYLRNEGTIVNNGTVALTGAAAESANAQTVKSLKLTGDTGKVMVEKTVEGSKVMETYTNSGLKLFPPAGTLDLRGADSADISHWEDQGYKWEVTKGDDGNGNTVITSAKLTLAPGFNATQVSLPDTTVEIETQGECTIGKLSSYYAVSPDNTHADKTKLTFSGAGPLTVQNFINICGGHENTLTVARDAVVIAKGGISVCADGAVDGVVTVNGTLTSYCGEGGAAVLTGKVKIGSTGQLTVSGERGVSANGTSSGDFQNAFVIQRGGRFDANCKEYNIVISAEIRSLPDDLGSVIKLPDGYLPSGYRLDKSKDSSSNTASITNDPAGLRYESGTLKGALNGKFALHETHQWPSGWLNDSTNHWKTCNYDGCKQMQGPYPHTYDGDWDATCNTCGYRRSTSHTHSFGDWTYDADNHWKQCVCGERTQTGAHVFDDDQDLVCDTCGYDRGADHTHDWSEDWTSSETHHWHECAASGCPVTADADKDGYGAHVYDNSRDTGCNTCGYERTVAPSRPSGGGGGVSTYAVTVEPSARGGVSSSHTRARSGVTVTLTVTPDEGYRLDTLTVTDSQDNEIKLTAQDGGRYTFTMPARAVTVQAAFAADWNSPYPDVPEGAPYWEAVRYVTENGLMSGYGSGLFGPDNSLTRAQFAQILHNREGRPVVNYLTRFEDVSDGAWYTEAVRWAAAQGIVGGYGDGRFGPDDPVTREQLALMLWRYAGSPAAGQELPFPDADEASGYALDALRWAAENGIISSSGGGRLEPRSNATRAQTAEMLKNFHYAQLHD